MKVFSFKTDFIFEEIKLENQYKNEHNFNMYQTCICYETEFTFIHCVYIRHEKNFKPYRLLFTPWMPVSSRNCHWYTLEKMKRASSSWVFLVYISFIWVYYVILKFSYCFFIHPSETLSALPSFIHHLFF